MTQKIKKYEFVSIEARQLFDINAKMEMARQIIVRICIGKEYDTNSNNNLILKEGSKYFPPKILKQLIANAHTMHNKSVTKTFSSWIKNSILKRDLYLMENNAIDKISRDIIIEYYVRKRTLLTKDKFIIKLNNFAYQRALDVEAYMKTRGFKSKQLPHSTECILIEDSELRFARMKYLQSMEQNRKAGAHIVYIDTKIANSTGSFVEKIKLSYGTQEVLTIFQRAVSPVLGMLCRNVKETSIILNFGNYNDLYCFQMKWIIETVAPQISNPSVFVIEDNILYGQTRHGNVPTMYSSKKEMVNWLEVNDIPHCPSMHSAELFELIKKSNRNFFKKKYILDEILMSYGHKVLRRPQGTNYLDYFDTLWEKVTYKPLSEKVYLFYQSSSANWKCMDKALSATEHNVLKEDIAVNNTIEKLLTYAKNVGISHSTTQLLYHENDIDEVKMEDIIKII